MTIGEKIKMIRKELKISQEELAKILGVKQQAISQFEKSSNLKYETIEKIAGALKIPVTYFFDNDSEIKSFDDIEITHDNTIIINDADPETPLNKALHKMQTGEPLTEKENKMVSEYFQSDQFKNAWEHMKKTAGNSLKRLKQLQAAYENLNEVGQGKVAEHAEMLAKIPEYRKENDKTVK